MKILVVDDEFVALAKLIALLEPYGECQAATNGAQAMEFFSKALQAGDPYGLVTLDIQMPDLNGLDALGCMVQREKTSPATPARKIVISAAPRRANVSRAAQYGCDGFLVKPVSREALGTLLAKLGISPAKAKGSAAPSSSTAEPPGGDTPSPQAESDGTGKPADKAQAAAPAAQAQPQILAQKPVEQPAAVAQ